MKQQWFSSKIRLICLIESKGSTLYMDSIFVFSAKNFKEAFQKSLQLGRDHERRYVNADGEKVLWKLKEIISLDIIRQKDLDGVEVYSELVVPDGEIEPFDSLFYPETSKPTQTI